jgi:hypothetical protein
VLVLNTPHHSAIYLGMLPWMSSKVELVADGVRHPVKDLAYFGRPENGVFYVITLPTRDPSASVTAYDVCDHPHARPPSPVLGGIVCPAPPQKPG